MIAVVLGVFLDTGDFIVDAAAAFGLGFVRGGRAGVPIFHSAIEGGLFGLAGVRESLVRPTPVGLLVFLVGEWASGSLLKGRGGFLNEGRCCAALGRVPSAGDRAAQRREVLPQLRDAATGAVEVDIHVQDDSRRHGCSFGSVYVHQGGCCGRGCISGGLCCRSCRCRHSGING